MPFALSTNLAALVGDPLNALQELVRRSALLYRLLRPLPPGCWSLEKALALYLELSAVFCSNKPCPDEHRGLISEASKCTVACLA